MNGLTRRRNVRHGFESPVLVQNLLPNCDRKHSADQRTIFATLRSHVHRLNAAHETTGKVCFVFLCTLCGVSTAAFRSIVSAGHRTPENPHFVTPPPAPPRRRVRVRLRPMRRQQGFKCLNFGAAPSQHRIKYMPMEGGCTGGVTGGKWAGPTFPQRRLNERPLSSPVSLRLSVLLRASWGP